MDRHTPTVSELVRRAVAICDPDDDDPVLANLEEQLEDDDEPVTAVENLEERLAIALEGTDVEVENPAVAVATALILFLAAHGGHGDDDRDPEELIHLAVTAQWRGRPPDYVADWLTGR